MVVDRYVGNPHPHPPSPFPDPHPRPQQPTRFVTAPQIDNANASCMPDWLSDLQPQVSGLWFALPYSLITNANCWPASWRFRPHKEIAAWPSLRDRPPNQARRAIGDSSRRAILKINVPGACRYRHSGCHCVPILPSEAMALQAARSARC